MTVSFLFGLVLSSQNIPPCHEYNTGQHPGNAIKMTQTKVRGCTRTGGPPWGLDHSSRRGPWRESASIVAGICDASNVGVCAPFS